MDKQKIQIRAPLFELYQTVTLSWNGQECSAQIVARWFELDYGDEGHWSYKLAGSEQLYPEGVLEPRVD